MRIMKFCYSLQSRASLGLQRISKLVGGSLIPDRRVLLGYGSILALAWGSAGSASAQYAYGEAYDANGVSDETLVLVEETVEAAADDLYEQLVGELECANALDVGCTLSLPVTGPGSACSCSASGANARCAGPFKDRNGVITHITCSDGQSTTTCRYTGPRGKPYDSCACTTR